jgi:hypothetical protein
MNAAIKSVFCGVLLAVSALGTGCAAEEAEDKGGQELATPPGDATNAEKTGEVSSELRKDCDDTGHICCNAWECCAWSPDLGWVCVKN